MHFLTVYKTFINDQECISGYARSPALTHSLTHSFTLSSREGERETERMMGVKMSCKETQREASRMSEEEGVWGRERECERH